MILVGNQRGGAADLARHLMKEENERVVLHEVRGFVSSDLAGAFRESYAISRGTRCKQHLYSLSLNPPKDALVEPEAFEDAVNRAEERLGLTGQPRAIVFHEKRGLDGEVRRHAHAVWCRIDVDEMKAVQLSYDKTKLQSVARDLYREHGWKMPRGFVRSQEANPRNYTLAEWQQAKRAEKDPAKLKAMFQDCWAVSDSQASLANALEENGYILARGDRRGVVAVDRQGEVYAVARYVGIKSKEVRARIKDADALPDVAQAHQRASAIVKDRLEELRTGQVRMAREKLQRLSGERRRLQRAHADYLDKMRAQRRSRAQADDVERQARIRTGWRGLIDRITGKRRRIEAENAADRARALRRDHNDRLEAMKLQQKARQAILAKARSERLTLRQVIEELAGDIRDLDQARARAADGPNDASRDDYVKRERRKSERPRRRSRPRDGPSPER